MNINDPQNWNDLSDIDDLPPLTSQDEACLEQLKNIILKNGMEHRFCVALLHKHFDLKENEILFETQNFQERTLTLKATNIHELKAKSIGYRPTAWRFDTNGVLTYIGCPGAGPYSQITNHYGYKDDD